MNMNAQCVLVLISNSKRVARTQRPNRSLQLIHTQSQSEFVRSLLTFFLVIVTDNHKIIGEPWHFPWRWWTEISARPRKPSTISPPPLLSSVTSASESACASSAVPLLSAILFAQLDPLCSAGSSSEHFVIVLLLCELLRVTIMLLFQLRHTSDDDEESVNHCPPFLWFHLRSDFQKGTSSLSMRLLSSLALRCSC